METKEIKFKEYLSSKNFKMTPEREIILKEVFATHIHFNADDLFIKIRKLNKRVSRATVYRTLQLLVESGLVRKISLGESHTYYEHIFGHSHHDHLICIKCGRIIEFVNDRIEDLQNRVCKEYDFKPENHNLQILGYCKKCI